MSNTISKRRQIGESITYEGGKRAYVYIYKGDYDDLETFAEAKVRGGSFEDGRISGWTLERISGHLGILRITCAAPDESGSGAGSGSVALTTRWSYRSVRCDLPIESYCGPSNSNPRRDHIDLWRKETNPTVQNAGKYRDQDGQLNDLSAADLAVAGKIKAGIESVMRFYPLVVKTSIYGAGSDDPPVEFNKVGYKDTPAKTFGYTGQWLKCQDDIAQNSDGTWTRTEGWMGAENLDNDLYGANRWPMPYSGS